MNFDIALEFELSILIYIPLIAGLMYLLLQIWIAGGWFRPISSQEPSQPPVTVIVAARNEADNLRELIPLLIQQTYPYVEIIIALDRCTDGSLQVLEEFEALHPTLRHLVIDELPTDWAGKKWALTQAIEAAQHEHLVFTDADCRMGPKWLSEVAAHWDSTTEVVLGLGPYPQYPGWLNRFIRFETFYAAFQYIGLAQNGIPYMAVGRNLAYRKSFFTSHGGFTAFQDRLSGDDDLLINAYAHAAGTQVMISPESSVTSEPKRTVKEWLSQKKRHLSASSKYSWRSQLILGAFHLSHLCFYAGILISLSLGPTASLPLSLYIGRIGLSWAIFGVTNKKLKMQGLMAYYPILDLLFFVYNLSVVPAGIMTQPEWKK